MSRTFAPERNETVNIQQMFPLFGQAMTEQVKHSIALLRFYEPRGQEYYGCFSGGKDSVVVKELARLAGVAVAWHYNATTIDPPELCRFIRREHPDVAWERPVRHFFQVLADTQGYPTRRERWCCREFKESHGHGHGQVMLTGIRAGESWQRKRNWCEFTRWTHGKKNVASWMCNPILWWSDTNVWEFIRSRELPYCSLYDEGWARLGCIGCPQGGPRQIERQFARWPQYEKAWRRAFHRLWERKRGDKMIRGKHKGKQWPGPPSITTADELFEWWKSGVGCPNNNDQSDCQMGMF